jgi:hypothetical protein
MILANPNGDVPSNYAKEDDVRAGIDEYIARNGVAASTIKAYFVDRNKEIVTVTNGEDHGQGQCGSAPGLTNPCEVGENHEIPWQRGVMGVTIISTAQTGSIFAGALGWDTLSGAARSSAYIFVQTTTGDISVQPIAIFRRPENYREFEFNQVYTLIESDSTQGGGNWGWVNWNGQSSSAQSIQALINCGYNPGTRTHDEWVARCPSGANTVGEGPTIHYTSTLVSPFGPDDTMPGVTPLPVYYLRYGRGLTGWWVQASSGAVNSNCNDFLNRVEVGGEWELYNGVLKEGANFYIPIFDKVYDTGGSTGLRYHLRQIVKFFIRKPVPNANTDPDPDVSCRPRAVATPTWCPTCPPSPTPVTTHWFIRGKAKSFYSNNASGELGDLRSTFGHIVALDR